MRTRLIMLAILAMATGSARAALRESYSVIKTTDWQKKVTYDVATDAELKERTQKARAEAMAGSKAAMGAQAEWRKDPNYGKKSFPRRVTMAASISKVGTYSDEGKAQEKATNLNAKLAEKTAAKKKAATNAKKGRSKEQNARDSAKENEKLQFEQAARMMFEGKLEEILNAAAKPAQP